MILTKEVFCRRPRQNAHFRKNTLFRSPQLNKIFILFNLVWTSKCPLSIALFIESRHTADQRHVRCASVRTINRCAALLCVAFELPTTLTDQSC